METMQERARGLLTKTTPSTQIVRTMYDAKVTAAIKTSNLNVTQAQNY